MRGIIECTRKVTGCVLHWTTFYTRLSRWYIPDPNQATSSLFLLILPHGPVLALKWQGPPATRAPTAQQTVLDAFIWDYEVNTSLVDVKMGVSGCKFNQLRATGSIDAGFWDSAALWINLWRLRIANHTHLWSDREAGWIPSNPLTYFASHCGSGIFALLDMELILEGPLFHYGGKSKKEVALSHSHSIPLRFWTVELIALEPVTIPIESSQIEQKRLTSSAAKKIWAGLLCASLCKPRVPGLGTSAAALPCELKSDFDRVKDLFLQTWEATSETYQHHVSPSWSLYQRLLLASRNSSNSLPIITTYR